MSERQREVTQLSSSLCTCLARSAAVLGLTVLDAGDDEGDTDGGFAALAAAFAERLLRSIEPLVVRGPSRRIGDWSLRGELRANENNGHSYSHMSLLSLSVASVLLFSFLFPVPRSAWRFVQRNCSAAALSLQERPAGARARRLLRRHHSGTH